MTPFTCEITEISRRWLRIRVSTPVTPTRRYWLSWDGDQLRESVHTRAIRERAPDVMSSLLQWLGDRWTRERIGKALRQLNHSEPGASS
jgi:hypothetical protein